MATPLNMLDLRDIRCIAFDAVGTLIFAKPSVAKVYTQVGREFGSQLAESEITKRFRVAMNNYGDSSASMNRSHDAHTPLATSEAREKQTWKQIVRQVLCDVDDLESCFNALFDHFGRAASWRCYDDVATSLDTLRRLRYKIAIASNFDVRLNKVCDGKPELASISVRVISSLIGYRKPSPLFYEGLLRETRCLPAQVLMVGDNEECDVNGANAAGINAIQICRGSYSFSQSQSYVTSLTQLIDVLKERKA